LTQRHRHARSKENNQTQKKNGREYKTPHPASGVRFAILNLHSIPPQESIFTPASQAKIPRVNRTHETLLRCHPMQKSAEKDPIP
jgi:hypothetical protein